VTPRFVHAALVLLSLPLLQEAGQRPYPERAASFLDRHLLVTWYGNPNSAAMGVLGRITGAQRARALRLQAAAYQPLTPRVVVPAYHVVAVVAQPTAGADGKWRRRESMAAIRRLLAEARAEGFLLILDVQPGRSSVEEELEYLQPLLREPDVHLALDPEFDMGEGQVRGRERGHIPCLDVVLDMDGFGSPPLKRATYAAIMAQRRLEFTSRTGTCSRRRS
jgi:hypothetical protein